MDTVGNGKRQQSASWNLLFADAEECTDQTGKQDADDIKA